MELRQLNKHELKQLYQTRMVRDFPPAERKPLVTILGLMKTGRYTALLAEEDGAAVGYALLWKTGDGKGTLLEYLGVMDDRRNQGVGGRLLEQLAARNTHLFGEAEAPISADPAENDLRLRRLGFYRRNGFRVLNYECALFGVRYRCLYRGPETEDGRVLEMHRGAYDAVFAPKRLHRYFQIPLHDGEEIVHAPRWLD